MVMATDPLARLTLVQWLSPAFPTGAYAYSHGLEQVIADGDVHDAHSLQDWLTQVLTLGAGWQDAVLLCLGLRDTDPDQIDEMALALAPSAERRMETLEQGAALARTVSTLSGQTLPARALPAALAEAARPLGLPVADVAAQFLLAFATNLVTIAVRHVPLGQTEGQQVLARVLPCITELAQRAAGAGPDDLGGAALGADLAAIRHETKEVRLFRT